MKKNIFFCAIGGSGMMPLALMMRAQGYDVRGSDRSYDQGRFPERFSFLQSQGVTLYPQDGSGVSDEVDEVVISSAVEDTVPDVQAAKAKNVLIRKRAEVLAGLFNRANTRLSIAGTSGKSTTTGMIGWILVATGHDPHIVNGAVMKNFVTPSMPYAGARVGAGQCFVAEADESDGSIALYNPTIAVLNNIARDHKEMDELRSLFRDYLARAEKVVLNMDNDEVSSLYDDVAYKAFTYSCEKRSTDFYAFDLMPEPTSISCKIQHQGQIEQLSLSVPGMYNVSNALAAVAASVAVGVPFAEAVQALVAFKGIVRRFDVIGQEEGITVIDDFAHNPDKIAALLRSLRQFEGRLLILFQPHGYGPLRLMKDDYADVFGRLLDGEDCLYITDPLYLGGTVDQSVGSPDLVASVQEQGIRVKYVASREQAVQDIILQAVKGDRVVIMGGRDDSLTALAHTLLPSLKKHGG